MLLLKLKRIINTDPAARKHGCRRPAEGNLVEDSAVHGPAGSSVLTPGAQRLFRQKSH